MPSDAKTPRPAGELMTKALDALESRIASFRSSISVAEEEVRSYDAQHRGAHQFMAEKALVELGPFAVGRIDPERFVILEKEEEEEIQPEVFEVLDRARAILASFGESQDIHVVEVVAGGDLRDAVKDALADVGRIFGAARAVELARTGRFDPDEHATLPGPFPFRRWNRAERQLAPPLVVSVGSEDLLPAGLGEFLDGAVKIVLVVEGPTTPAPLARLITPGTFVTQTADPADLEALAASRHPGVGLLFDEERPGQARFAHDPDAGDTPFARLRVDHLPEEPDVGRGRRTPTWLEELVHLKTLASAIGGPGLAEAVSGEVASPEGLAVTPPADQLAAWLLGQTNTAGL